MIDLICLMDDILFHTYKIILSTLLKRYETMADNPPVQIYVNKTKIKIVFKINIAYKLELLSSETMN